MCIDTCHAFTSGYDLRTFDAFQTTFSLFGNVIGFNYLKGIHLNDSKKDVGTRVDRHDNIGMGFIGNDLFGFIMADPRFDNMPLILETPDEERWAEEISMLKSLVR